MAKNASSSGANEKVRDADIAGFDTFESQFFGSIDSKSQLDVYLEEARFDHNTRMDWIFFNIGNQIVVTFWNFH